MQLTQETTNRLPTLWYLNSFDDRESYLKLINRGKSCRVKVATVESVCIDVLSKLFDQVIVIYIDK